MTQQVRVDAPRRLLLGVLALGSLAAGAHGQFTGVTWDGDAVAVYADGEGNVIGSTGLVEINALAGRPDGSLWAATKGPMPELIRIDPATGIAEFLTFSGLNDIRGLAFTPAGELYAIDSTGGGVQNDLYLYDLTYIDLCPCIDKVLIGQVSTFGITAMTSSADGTLYAWSTRKGLITIDKTTAVATDVNALDDGSSIIQSLTFTPDGALWGVYEELFSFNLTTGEPTIVGVGNYGNVRGFEYDPISFPALSVTDLLPPGGTIDVDLTAVAGESYALALALDPGPICEPTLPFCLELGPTASSVFVFSLGPMPTGGVHFSFPTPPDPALSSLTIHWQALTVASPAGPRKSNAAATTFL